MPPIHEAELHLAEVYVQTQLGKFNRAVTVLAKKLPSCKSAIHRSSPLRIKPLGQMTPIKSLHMGKFFLGKRSFALEVELVRVLADTSRPMAAAKG